MKIHEGKSRLHICNYSNAKYRCDEFYTSREEVEEIFEKIIPEGYLENKKIYCPCDSEQSEFVKYLKENKHIYKYRELIYTSDDFNTHIDLFDNSDFVITNPPFSKICNELFPILCNHAKDWFIFGSITSIYWYYEKNQYPNIKIYRAGHFNFYTPHINMITNKNYVAVNHSYLTNIECNNIYIPKNKISKTYDELYKDKEPVYLISINNKPCEHILNIDKIKDIPIDYEEIMCVPITVLFEFNKKYFEIIKVLHHEIKEFSDGKSRFIRILVKKKSKK